MARTRDLVVAVRDGTPRQVRVEGPDGTAAEAELGLAADLPARAAALRRAMVQRSAQRLARDIAADYPRDPPPPVSETVLGEELFRAVFADARLHGLYAVWRASDDRLRLRVRVPVSLAWLPWELLRDPHDRAWLALTNNISVLREVDSASHVRPSAVGRAGLDILGVGANPIDLPQLDVEHEHRLLKSVMRDNGRVTWTPGDTDAAVALIDDRRRHDHVFHFAGHGSHDASGGALYWGEGLAQRLDGERLATLLARHPTIRLAVLNACNGATSDQDAESPSIANALVQRGVPAVLAMQAPILDSSALDAARSFYGALSRGAAIDEAVSVLRRMLHTKNLDWASPVLTVASADRALFRRSVPLVARAWALGAVAAAVVISALAWLTSTQVSAPRVLHGDISPRDAGIDHPDAPLAIIAPSAPTTPPARVSPARRPDRDQPSVRKPAPSSAPPAGESRPANPAELEWAQWKMPNPSRSNLPNPAKYDTINHEVVIDKVTGLAWQRDLDPHKMTWAEAGRYCHALDLGGHWWRLPTFIELYSLVDFDAPAPAIDPVFPAVPSGGGDAFWTSTLEVGDPEDRTWVIHFFHGDPSVRRGDEHAFARCVRSLWRVGEPICGCQSPTSPEWRTADGGVRCKGKRGVPDARRMTLVATPRDGSAAVDRAT